MAFRGPATAPAAPKAALGTASRQPLSSSAGESPAPHRGKTAKPAVHTAIGWRMADAFLLMAGFTVLELLCIGLWSHRELVGALELGYAALGMLPLAVVAAAPLALIGGGIAELIAASSRRPARVSLGLGAAGAGGLVAALVSTGRHFDSVRQVAFVAVVAAVTGGLSFWLAPRLRALAARCDSGPLRLAFVGGLGLMVLALELGNLWILPRLYGAFHLALALLALLSVCLLTLVVRYDGAVRGGRSSRARASLLRAAGALVLFALCAAVAPKAAKSLQFADNVRFIYHERAPVLGQVLVLAARIQPPEPLTVDALRADHVGAYGYERATTPEIDALAREGAVFEHAYTPTPHTSYAITSLMTGKYMRPLVRQGLASESETWATHLRRYGYRTAAFYPPAIFFIDAERFRTFSEKSLDFEYVKKEFADPELRVAQVREYLGSVPRDNRLFLWVHLFEPHEPYEAHPEHDFGPRDIDRYDAEIAVADQGVGEIVRMVRARNPNTVVMLTADHGEEFGEHGGRYHGTTVYEEQVRVPLVIVAPGAVSPTRISTPVQLVDLLPTVLSGLEVPRPARLRGNDLGPLLTGTASEEQLRGFVFAESETLTLLGRGSQRLVCARRIGACALYDIVDDPAQHRDIATVRSGDVAELRKVLRGIEGSHGRFEVQGLRRDGKLWPEALRRGIAGDGDAAPQIAALLDDADVAIRRKAAEVLFELGRAEAAVGLRLALVRDEDDEVQRWCALALTRLGEGAPRTHEMLEDRDVRWRRLAALSMAEAGDSRGERTLLAWWRATHAKKETASKESISFERARELARALGKIRSDDAVGMLIRELHDVRLRPHLASALADIDNDAARPALAKYLESERHLTARRAIVDALVRLGAGPELRAPLIRLLGIPDPLSNGLDVAMRADLLQHVGGPRKRDLRRLREFATSGVAVGMQAPKGGDGSGVRVVCLARAIDGNAGELRFGRRLRIPPEVDRKSFVPAQAPELDSRRSVTLEVPPAAELLQVHAPLPEAMGVEPGDHRTFVLFATHNVEVQACAVVPLSGEIRPP